MSDAEHLIENAIMALERYPYEEAERYFMEKPINITVKEMTEEPKDGQDG